MVVCGFVAVIFPAKWVEQQKQQEPCEVHAPQWKAQCKRPEQEGDIFLDNILITIALQIKYDYGDNMDDIKMEDVEKERDPAIHIHDPGKPAAVSLQ